MIKFYVGEDTYNARKLLREEVELARKESPYALYVRFDETSFDPESVHDAFSGGGMFNPWNILIFEDISEHADGESFYENLLPQFIGTEHRVYILEKKLTKKILEKFKDKAIISEFTPPKKREIAQNNFAIADAIGAKDKKNIWVEFEKARRSGRATEELHGTIFWAFKSLYICGTMQKEEALASGVKEYTFRTYKNYSKNYLVNDLKKILTQLKEMYHDAHRGEGDLGLALERMLLSL